MKKIYTFIFLFALLSVYTKSTAQKVLLDENFNSNRNNWLSYSGKTTFLIYNGKLVFSVSDSNTYNIDMPATIEDGKDFSVTATATHTDGIVDHGYGFYFGASDFNNYYIFAISNNGYYRIGKNTLQNGALAYTDIVKWTSSSAIKTGNYIDNILQISRQGANWVFSVNGQVLSTVPAQPFIGNKIGLTVTYPQRIEWDDVKVTSN